MFETLLNLFKTPVAGEKATMDKETPTTPAAGAPAAATPAPVATPAVDQKTLADLLKSTVSEIVKPLQDEIATLRKGGEKTADAEKPLSASELTTLLDKRDQSRATSERANSARTKYLAESLKGIPAAYARDLPATEDAAVLAAEGEKIRVRYRADLEAAGVRPPNVSGAGGAAAGSPPGAAVNTSKLTAGQKIELSIARSAMKGAPGRK
jgi:hypothetical protein